MTPTRLAAMWPEARLRIVTALRAAGVDVDVAEEAVAEAATRALAKGLVVEDVDEFCRWAFVVARNVVADTKRRSSRVVLIDVMPEQVDGYDMANHIEIRQRLQHAARVIAGMPATDRAALLQSLDGHCATEDRRQAVKQAVRRHRARSRLLRALGAPAGWLSPLRLHRLGGNLARIPAETFTGVALLVPLMAAAWSALPAEGSVTPAAVVASPVEQASAEAPLRAAPPPPVLLDTNSATTSSHRGPAAVPHGTSDAAPTMSTPPTPAPVVRTESTATLRVAPAPGVTAQIGYRVFPARVEPITVDPVTLP